MAVSQFTVYTSADYGGPGPLYGNGATLLSLYNQCLVSGYSGKAAAGWTKMGSAGSVINDSGNIGIFKQGAGCGYYLYLNDNQPDTVSMGFRAAWGAGFKTMTSLVAGTGPFPTAAQTAAQGGTGGYGYQKSNDGTSPRSWQLYADASTSYLFINDGSGYYGAYLFGDIYSLWGSSDLNRCAICLANSDRGAIGLLNGCLDRQVTPVVTTVADAVGLYLADNYAGTSWSMIGYPVGDPGRYSGLMSTTTGIPLVGSIPLPNPMDSSLYISPVWILDANWNVRGRLRGLWYPCHPMASFSDGMVISGSGDYSSRQFNVIKPGWGGGVFLMEITNTVEIN